MLVAAKSSTTFDSGKIRDIRFIEVIIWGLGAAIQSRTNQGPNHLRRLRPVYPDYVALKRGDPAGPARAHAKQGGIIQRQEFLAA